MKTIGLRIAFALLAAGVTSLAWAHGGGLDANGCHSNRRTGDYHCHRANVLPVSNSQPAPQQNAFRSSTTNRIDNTCYTGPRGGRYRIVNGRKRYDC